MSNHSLLKRIVFGYGMLQYGMIVAVIRAVVVGLRAFTLHNVPSWLILFNATVAAVLGLGCVCSLVWFLCVRRRGLGPWSVALVSAMGTGFKSSGWRSGFDWVLLGRKIGIIWISVFYDDPLSSSVVTLCTSGVVWLLVVKWNPYVTKLTKTTARSANVVILSLQACCCCCCIVYCVV
jgi:hypothetical protein